MRVWVIYIRKCGAYYKLFISTFHPNVQGPTVLHLMNNVIVNANQKKYFSSDRVPYLGQISEIECVVGLSWSGKHTATHPVVHSNGRRHQREL